MSWYKVREHYMTTILFLVIVLICILCVDFFTTKYSIAMRFERQVLLTMLIVHITFVFYSFLFLCNDLFVNNFMFFKKMRIFLFLIICFFIVFSCTFFIFPLLYSRAQPTSWTGCVLESIFLFTGFMAILSLRENLDRKKKIRELEEITQFLAMQQVVLMMQPHFLLNCFNTVQALLYIDQEKALEATRRLRSLFLHIIGILGTPAISLATELAVVRDYLTIQQLRFSERLSFEIKSDFDTEQYLIPALSIQVLVENAIKHGLQKNLKGDHLMISVHKKDHGISICVEQNFPSGEKPCVDFVAEWEQRKPQGGFSMMRRRLMAFDKHSSEFVIAIHENQRLCVSFFLEVG